MKNMKDMKKLKKNRITRSIWKATATGCLFAAAMLLCSCGLIFDSSPFGSTFCDHSYTGGKYISNPMGHYAVCDKCGESQDELTVHRYGDLITVSQPTENADGEGFYECRECGYKKEQVIHDFVKVELKNSTCHSHGNYEHYVCNSCGKLFDTHYDETTSASVHINPKDHSSVNPNPVIITQPTVSSDGLIKFLCDNFDTCHGYTEHLGKTLEVVLPPLEPEENYSVTSKSGATYILKLKEEYVKTHLEARVSSDIYRSRIATAISQFDFTYYACDAVGHKFTPESYITDENKVIFICEHDASHRLEIVLPDFSDSIYSSRSAHATCARPAGREYFLSYSAWKTNLEKYSDQLIYEGYTLHDYALELYNYCTLFKSDGGEPNKDRHDVNENVTILNYTLPTYNVTTHKVTDGQAKCHCSDCDTIFYVTISYTDGVWRNDSVADYLVTKFYRDYTVYGKTLTAPVRQGFDYCIDANGGTPKSSDIDISGVDMLGGKHRIFEDDFVREGYIISGVTLLVDYNTNATSERVVKTTGWVISHGNCTYWDIDMDSAKYMGDMRIKIIWTKV